MNMYDVELLITSLKHTNKSLESRKNSPALMTATSPKNIINVNNKNLKIFSNP